jgi:hypothetical protein
MREGIAPFLDDLEKIIAFTNKKWKPPRGRPLSLFHLNADTVISELDAIYKAARGKPGGAGRRHDHYARSTRHGRPDGPFFRLVRATFELIGVTPGDEAILKAIKWWVKERNVIEEFRVAHRAN